MKKTAVPHCDSPIHQYDGTVIGDATTEEQAKAILTCLLKAFAHDERQVANLFANYWNGKPRPRPKHAVCCVLTKGNTVKTNGLDWMVVDEPNSVLPIRWELLTEPDQEVLVFVYVAFGKAGKGVMAHAFHKVRALVE